MEKIFAHVTARKMQNAVQATGDRMAMTPQQFGMHVGKQMGKQALFGPIGAGLGVITSPEGHRMEGAARGAVKGTGAGLGALAGTPLGVLAMSLLLKGRGRKIPLSGAANPMRRPMPFTQNQVNRQNLGRALATLGLGVPAGATVGGVGGYAATSAVLGKPSWESTK